MTRPEVSGPAATDALAVIERVIGQTPPRSPDTRSTAQIEAEDRLEEIAADRAFEARFGRASDRDADRAADAYFEALERQAER